MRDQRSREMSWLVGPQSSVPLWSAGSGTTAVIFWHRCHTVMAQLFNDNSLIQKFLHFAQTNTWTGWHNILLPPPPRPPPRLTSRGGRAGGQSMVVLGIRFVLTRLNREITARSLSCGQTGHLAPLSQTVNTQHTRHSNVCICCHQPSNHPTILTSRTN